VNVLPVLEAVDDVSEVTIETGKDYSVIPVF